MSNHGTVFETDPRLQFHYQELYNAKTLIEETFIHHIFFTYVPNAIPFNSNAHLAYSVNGRKFLRDDPKDFANANFSAIFTYFLIIVQFESEAKDDLKISGISWEGLNDQIQDPL
ncbi:unnamed protein product, partial [Mesorhabditis spiculigera]